MIPRLAQFLTGGKHRGGIRGVHIVEGSVEGTYYFIFGKKTQWNHGTFLFPYFKHFLNSCIFIFSIFVFIYVFLMFEMRENPIAKGYLSGTRVQNIKWRVPWSTT